MTFTWSDVEYHEYARESLRSLFVIDGSVQAAFVPIQGCLRITEWVFYLLVLLERLGGELDAERKNVDPSWMSSEDTRCIRS